MAPTAGVLAGTSLLLVGIAFGKVSSMLREMLIAGQFGANYQVDAYVLAITIPSVLAELVSGGGLTAALMPYVAEHLRRGPKEEAWRNVSAILNVYTVMMIAIAGTAIVVVPLGAPVWAGRLDGGTAQTILELLPITLTSLVFHAAIAVHVSVLNQLRYYQAQALLPVLLNLPILFAAAFIAPIFGIASLGMGYAAGTGLAAAALFEMARRRGVSYHLVFRLPSAGAASFLMVLLPALMSTLVPQVNLLVDRSLASTLPAGSLSMLVFGGNINTALLAFAIALATAIFPAFNDLHLEKGMPGVVAELLRVSRPLLFLMVPLGLLVVSFSDPLIYLFLQRGAFDANARHGTALVLQALGVGLPAMAFYYIAQRVFWAATDTLTPFGIGLVTGVVNVVLDLVLMGPVGQVGIAASSSIVAWCSVGISLVLLRRRTNARFDDLFKSVGKYLLASLLIPIIAASGGFLVVEEKESVDLIRFGLFFVGAIAAYLLVAVLFRWSEMNLLMRKAREVKGRFLPEKRGTASR